MTDYSLFGATAGPAAATAYTGAYGAGCLFSVTSGGKWLRGYRWWVCGTGQQVTAGQKFALWQVNGPSNPPSLVPGSTVAAGILTAGAWNTVLLPSPIPLAPCGTASGYGAVYCAATAWPSGTGFPEVKNQFGGGGQPYSAGIVNGPLTGYSSISGSLPLQSQAPSTGAVTSWNKGQQPYMLAGDPTTACPATNDSDAFLGMDIVVTDVPPPGVQSYRGFPSMPLFVSPGVSAQTMAYTIGLQFSVSAACALTRIWHYSPPGSTILPSRCALWDVSSQSVVPGTDNQSPAWSGAAASGWVSCDYTASGVTLQAGKAYKVSVFTPDNVNPWFLAQDKFWGGVPGPFASGITNGPLTIAGNAAATPGQDSWIQSTTWGYPSVSTSPEFDGLDVEVTPLLASGTGLLMASGIV